MPSFPNGDSEDSDGMRGRWPTPCATLDAPRAGRCWERSDDETLRTMVLEQYSLGQMAKQLGRAQGAIVARLHYIGLADRGGVYLPHIVAQQRGTSSTNKPIVEKTMSQNLNYLITLLQKGYTTIAVRYREHANTYTFKVPQKVADELKVGDWVVVPSGADGVAVARVAEVHSRPQIDPSAPYTYRWIVQRVDRSAYDDQDQREKAAIKQLEDAERLRAQREALDALLGAMGDRETFLALLNGPDRA